MNYWDWSMRLEGLSIVMFDKASFSWISCWFCSSLVLVRILMFNSSSFSYFLRFCRFFYLVNFLDYKNSTSWTCIDEPCELDVEFAVLQRRTSRLCSIQRRPSPFAPKRTTNNLAEGGGRKRRLASVGITTANDAQPVELNAVFFVYPSHRQHCYR